MSRSRTTAVLIALGVCAGCGTIPTGIGASRTPVDAAELQRKVDAVLDYTAGTADALPLELFSVAPLANTGKDAGVEIQEMADEMRQHYAELSKLKARRVLGEDNRGYLTIRDNDSFAGADDKNAVQKAMAAENDSRKSVYRGIAQASEEKGLTLTRVERAFAERRLARAAPGALVQLPTNDQEFKAFQQSPIGKQLGEMVHPGDWVGIP